MTTSTIGAYLQNAWPHPKLGGKHVCNIRGRDIVSIAQGWGTPELRVRGHLDKRPAMSQQQIALNRLMNNAIPEQRIARESE